MTENIWLVLFGLLVSVAIWWLRRYVVARQMQPMSSYREAVIRLVLMICAAILAHIIGGARNYGGLSFWLAVAVNSFLMYGVSHFFDRLLFPTK